MCNLSTYLEVKTSKVKVTRPINMRFGKMYHIYRMVSDEVPKCAVETVDVGAKTATLACAVTYSWHALSMQFHVVPEVTATLSWDGSPNAARQNSHAPGEDYPSNRLESYTRVSISSPDDATQHTCTVTFTFTPGKMYMSST